MSSGGSYAIRSYIISQKRDTFSGNTVGAYCIRPTNVPSMERITLKIDRPDKSLSPVGPFDGRMQYAPTLTAEKCAAFGTCYLVGSVKRAAFRTCYLVGSAKRAAFGTCYLVGSVKRAAFGTCYLVGSEKRAAFGTCYLVGSAKRAAFQTSILVGSEKRAAFESSI